MNENHSTENSSSAEQIEGVIRIVELHGPHDVGHNHAGLYCTQRLLRVAPLTDGSADRSLIPVRDVLTSVLGVGGTSFAVAHNHPSGSLTPSPEDTEVTMKLREAAATVGVRFLDHVILTETSWARVL